MKNSFFKIMGITFALALILNVALAVSVKTENPPLHGTNTITQLHLS